FFSSRRRHTRCLSDWSSDVCSSDLRFRTVNAAAYATPIVLLFLITALGGGLLYPKYRVDVRPALEDLQLRAANGIFEIKEHLVRSEERRVGKECRSRWVEDAEQEIR